MAQRRPGSAWGIIGLTALALATAASAGPLAAGVAPAPAAVQQLRPTAPAKQARLESEHFEVLYDPALLSAEDAARARDLAERGWAHCKGRFGGEPEGKLQFDLTPDFRGATGFARPGDPNARDAAKRPLIGVRFGELDYLGLSAEYVITHEIAHIFSGKVAGTSLGEGAADWGAAQFNGIPQQPWFGKALREAGLWIDPDAFFITGDFPANPEVNAIIRTSLYAEAGLLVQYLVEKGGWQKFAEFAAEYGKARGRLESNEDRRRQAARPGPRRGAERDASAVPDPEAVRAVFREHYGETWETLRRDWEQRMEAETPPPARAQRLTMAHRIYGAVRNYEMWALQQRPGPSAEVHAVVREAFTLANRRLREGDLDGAAEALARAETIVRRVRSPQVITRSFSRPAVGAA
ncbi:MAG: hypothetical protein ACK47B_13880 [Armatimonadota bacterium]